MPEEIKHLPSHDAADSERSGDRRLTSCSRSWLVCDGCGKLWKDTTENLGEMCECGRICIRMEWATEKDRLAAIHQKATSALQTSWLYSGKEHVEKLMREIAAISSENVESIHPETKSKPEDVEQPIPSGLDETACSRLSDAEKYADPSGPRRMIGCSRVEEQLLIALDGHPESELWGEHGLIAATMRCVEAIEKLDAALVARIKKWADWKQNPDDHMNGCDPKWYEGWITGKLEELQNVREMLLCLQSGKSMAWAIPSEHAQVDLPDTAAQDSASKSNNPAVSG